MELLDGLVFESALPDLLAGMAEKIGRAAKLPGPTPASDFSSPAPEVGPLGVPSVITAAVSSMGGLLVPAGSLRRTGRPNVGQSVRVGMGLPNTWEQAAIILKVHEPLGGVPDWACDLALLVVGSAPSLDPVAVRSMSGVVIGHCEATPPPGCGVPVVMSHAEKVEDANCRPGTYGWRYAD